MQYNRLGKSGLQISEVSFGSWLTFGNDIDVKRAKVCMHYAYEQGINFFDNAESYAQGESEIVMGEALKDFRRESLVVSTKLFWGAQHRGINEQGLSRKHIIAGTKSSLKRLQLDYIDLLFCHRPDPNTPIEETVLAMDYLIRQGYALYWGTSEWSAKDIATAYQLAKQLHCIPPTMEQPQYNLFHRYRVETEYAPLYELYGLGTTIWSPLASGLLTGKYNNGIPKDSRIIKHPEFKPEQFEQKVECVKKLAPIAKELNCTLSQLALAWCLQNPQVNTVILGASHIEQLQENLGAIAVKAKLTDDIINTLHTICEKTNTIPK